MNKGLKRIYAEVITERIQEQEKEKLCLIEDVIKVKKMLYGMGHEQHNEFLNEQTAADLFDVLYEHDIPTLQFLLREYSQIATNTAKQRIIYGG
mgnify:FL=1